MIVIDLSLPFIGNSDSLDEWNIIEREEKQQKMKQSIIKGFQYFSTLIKWFQLPRISYRHCLFTVLIGKKCILLNVFDLPTPSPVAEKLTVFKIVFFWFW